LKIIHWVAGCNSYDSSGKRRHDFAVKMYNSNNNKIISIFKKVKKDEAIHHK
jgi:hypothetical protein